MMKKIKMKGKLVQKGVERKKVIETRVRMVKVDIKIRNSTKRKRRMINRMKKNKKNQSGLKTKIVRYL